MRFVRGANDDCNEDTFFVQNRNKTAERLAFHPFILPDSDCQIDGGRLCLHTID